MSFRGTVVNGQIVLDQPAPLPEGARVEITMTEPAKPEEKPQPTLAALMKYAGCLPDLPPDFAQQHDHYIHGTPRR